MIIARQRYEACNKKLITKVDLGFKVLGYRNVAAQIKLYPKGLQGP